MDWEKPRVLVIDMNAEIGGYQADLEDTPAPNPRAEEVFESECAPRVAPNVSSE